MNISPIQVKRDKTSSSGIFCLSNIASNPPKQVDLEDYIKTQLVHMI